MSKKKWNAYQNAGVNRDLADQLVQRISMFSKSDRFRALGKNLIQSIGGYASVYQVSKDTCIAASTDGVGTKLKLAFEYSSKKGLGHSSVGQDLVAMSVNDLLCVGAKPLFFLDYFATGKLNPSVAATVVEGISNACLDSNCILVGGETAEMPGFYQAGEYDLAGFAVGQVHPSQVLPRKEIQPGLVLIGLPSSGFHSNGYSLVRKVLNKWKATQAQKTKVAQMLLTPTRLYARPMLPLLEQNLIEGAAHITGSGFLNLPRISNGVSYEIELPKFSKWPKSFHWFKEASQNEIPFFEWAQTFNCGVGMVIAVKSKAVKKVMGVLQKHEPRAFVLGETIRKEPGLGRNECFVTVRTEQEGAILFYE